MEEGLGVNSIFQNKKIKYNNKKPTKNGIIWINFSKIRKACCTLTPLSLRSARLTQYMRFARCTSLSHILLRFTTQNIAYTEMLYGKSLRSIYRFFKVILHNGRRFPPIIRNNFQPINLKI